jgi:hypothetical protein
MNGIWKTYLLVLLSVLLAPLFAIATVWVLVSVGLVLGLILLAAMIFRSVPRLWAILACTSFVSLIIGIWTILSPDKSVLVLAGVCVFVSATIAQFLNRRIQRIVWVIAFLIFGVDLLTKQLIPSSWQMSQDLYFAVMVSIFGVLLGSLMKGGVAHAQQQSIQKTQQFSVARHADKDHLAVMSGSRPAVSGNPRYPFAKDADGVGVNGASLVGTGASEEDGKVDVVAWGTAGGFILFALSQAVGWGLNPVVAFLIGFALTAVGCLTAAWYVLQPTD